MSTPVAPPNDSPVFDEPSIAGAAISQEFASRPLIFSLARILAFSGGELAEPGWPHRNLHTDIAKAREAGLPDIIASGTQTEGLLVEMLIDLFGEAWLHRGVIEIKFPRSVFVGDTVCCRAVLREIQRLGGRDRYRLDVWCENQAGDKVIIGTAACALDPRPSRDPDASAAGRSDQGLAQGALLPRASRRRRGLARRGGASGRVHGRASRS